MLSKHDVAVRMATLLLPGLLYALPAASEGQRDSQRHSDESDRSSPVSKVPTAPVGHRQPTARDVPRESPKDAAEEERQKRERELDAKLQICLGC